ncbi:amidohydrolase family protein [Bacteroidota bacterium]
MKTIQVSVLLWILCILQCFGQSKINRLPVIDMHLHVYTPQNYRGGSDVQFRDTLLESPADQSGHMEAVIQQINKYNIVITYASGSYAALDIINKKHPGLFLSSAEIWPTRDLLSDINFIDKLKSKIENGEVRGIGEVVNFYTGIAPNDPVLDTLYKIAEDNDLPIGLHFAPGPPGSQQSYYPNMRLEYGNPLMIQDVLIKFPKLRLNIMHAGLPIFKDETFGILLMFPNVYVDISAQCWYCDYTKEILDDFLIKSIQYGFGDRIMFGSDEMNWPGTIGLSIDYINNADFLTEKQKRDILYNNAAKFLRLTEDEIKKHHQNSK